MKRRVLVTGHTGFLGSACVRHFQKTDTVLVIEQRLKTQEQCTELFRDLAPDLIVHCAAKVGGVGANKAYPVEFLRDNLNLQNAVIEAADRANVQRLVFVATSCMYPANAPLPVREDSLFTGKLDPSVEAYAVAKIAGHLLCRAYSSQYGRDYMTAVPSNIIGPGDNYDPASSHVLASLCYKLREAVKNKQASMIIWGDGTQVREFVHVDDVASAIHAVARANPGPEPINVGTGESTTIKELAELLLEVSGYKYKIRLIWDTSKPRGVEKKTFDTSRLKALGWSPKVSLRDAVLSSWLDLIKNRA